jgi:hypothetical protein
MNFNLAKGDCIAPELTRAVRGLPLQGPAV